MDPFRDLNCCAVTPQPVRASAGGLGSRPIIGCSQAGGECPGHQRTCLGLETRVKTDPSCWLVAPHFHMWAFPETVWVCSQPGGWLLAHEQWGLRTRSLAPHGHECVLAATRQCPHPPAIRGAHITPLLSAGHTSPRCYPRGTHHPAAIHGAHITPLLSAGHTSPCCYPWGTHHLQKGKVSESFWSIRRQETTLAVVLASPAFTGLCLSFSALPLLVRLRITLSLSILQSSKCADSLQTFFMPVCELDISSRVTSQAIHHGLSVLFSVFCSTGSFSP